MRHSTVTTVPGGDTEAWATSTWAQVTTLTGAGIAAAVVVLTLIVNARRARRDRSRQTISANALGAVANYLEGPYRILRKDGTARDCASQSPANCRTSKSKVDRSQALLRLHANPEVADAYDDYVHTAAMEAGQQMHEAWLAPPVTTDAGVNLNIKLARDASAAALARLCEVCRLIAMALVLAQVLASLQQGRPGHQAG